MLLSENFSILELITACPCPFYFFQAGHVTKSGDIAGPRVLEHIVDVVLYMEVGTSLAFSFSIIESCLYFMSSPYM